MKRTTQAEIDEMWLRGFDPLTIKEAKFSRDRTAQADQLCEQIRQAFADVQLGQGVGLFCGRALDEYGTPEEISAARARDEKYDRASIPAELLNACRSSLSFFDAEGFRFHIPAFMIGDLQDTFYAGDSTVFALTFEVTRKVNQDYFALLSADQTRAVRAYLKFCLEDPEHQCSRRQIERALDEYWDRDSKVTK